MQQLSFFDDVDAASSEWNNDDWETPPEVARQMAKLVKDSDRRILEPCAGTGMIVQELRTDAYIQCIEKDHLRYRTGLLQLTVLGQCSWICGDFLEANFKPYYDLIITNPPFSAAIDFIEKSLSLLNKDNPDARLLYLLPNDYFAFKRVHARMSLLDAHIHHVYQIAGRVPYLRDGKPYNRRRKYDAVFDIRPDKENNCITYLNDL